MKRFFMILMVVLGVSVSFVYAQNDIIIKINGEDFVTQNKITIQNDRVMVPMREIFENFKAEVSWNNETRTVTTVKDDICVKLQINNDYLLKNDNKVQLDAPAIIENDITMIPLSAVFESFGAEVKWDGDGRCVYINYEEDLKKEIIPIKIEMQDGGIMKADLYSKIAPETVENFVKLAKAGFYDGLVFHRVIEDFMIHGGGFDKDYNMKETAAIKGEFTSNGFENNLKHTRGVLSMARTMNPNSASSQFFIMHKESPNLDGEYAAFGMITEGFDVLDKIATTKTTRIKTPFGEMSDVPLDLQIIKTITVDIEE